MIFNRKNKQFRTPISLDLGYYNDVVIKVFGESIKDVAYAFAPDVDQYVDSQKKIDITKKYGNIGWACYYNMFTKNKFGDQVKYLSSEITELTIRTPDEFDKSGVVIKSGIEYKFIRIMTPFNNSTGFDFIVSKNNDLDIIIKEIDRRRNTANITEKELPKLIGIDIKYLEDKIMGVLIDEKYREFCRTHNIASKKAFIFHGLPGNGKTSFINYLRVLASQNNIKEYIIGSAKEFMESVDNIVGDSTSRKLVILEEFDGYMQEKAFDKGDGEEAVNASPVTVKIQELLDGVKKLNNCVVIFTTNHPTGFDEALVRPGRIDDMIAFDAPTRDYSKDFLDLFGSDIVTPDFKKLIIEELYSSDTKVSYAMLKKIIDILCEFKFYNPDKPITNENVLSAIKSVQNVQNKSKKTRKTKSNMI